MSSPPYSRNSRRRSGSGRRRARKAGISFSRRISERSILRSRMRRSEAATSRAEGNTTRIIQGRDARKLACDASLFLSPACRSIWRCFCDRNRPGQILQRTVQHPRKHNNFNIRHKAFSAFDPLNRVFINIDSCNLQAVSQFTL